MDSSTAGLQRLLGPGIRFFLSENLEFPEDPEQVQQAVFRALEEAIRRGELSEAAMLVRLVKQELKRQIAAVTGATVNLAGLCKNQCWAGSEATPAIVEALRQLGATDREIVIGYYAGPESRQALCAELQLTEAAFESKRIRAARRLRQAIDQQSELAKESTAVDNIEAAQAQAK